MLISFTGFLCKIVLLLLNYEVGAGNTYAAHIPTIELSDSLRIYSIGNQVALLEDSTGRLSIEEIVNKQSQFRLSTQQIPIYGTTQAAIWCAFEAKNFSQEDWYLEIGTPFMPQIDLYRQMPNGKFIHEQLGTNHPYRQRTVRTNQFIIPLQVRTGECQRFYLRFSSNHTLSFPLRIASLQTLYESNQGQDVLHGMYFGLLLALMIYNMFVFVALGDKAYLYYVLYVLFLSLNIAYQRGYGFQFLWPQFPALNSPNIFAGMGSLCTVLFTNTFLNTRQYIPKLRSLHWLIILPVVVNLLLTLTGYAQAGFMVQIGTSMLLILYVFTIGIAVYLKGFTPAKYYLMGFGSLVGGIVIFIMKDVRLLPYNGFTEAGMQIGSALEAVILSFALVNKMHVYKKEKEQAQTSALEQASSFAQQLIQTQEQERERVAAELHDSVGQSLGLIKNRLLLLQQPAQQIAAAKLTEVTQSVAQTLEEVRQISYGLRPVQLDLLGLSKAIERLVRDTASGSGIQFYEEIDNIDRFFSKEAQMNIYRIVQESLSNMVKHAEATKAIIRIKHQQKSVRLWIEDDGIGMDNTAAAIASGGSGIMGIRQRLKLLGGTLEINKANPTGTILSISIPIPIPE